MYLERHEESRLRGTSCTTKQSNSTSDMVATGLHWPAEHWQEDSLGSPVARGLLASFQASFQLLSLAASVPWLVFPFFFSREKTR